jgi:putative PIN family toxin of toxin-antitoxin system
MDTNVFIAAMLSPAGENRDTLRACIEGKAHPLMGAALFHEYEDVMRRSEPMRKSPLRSGDRQTLFEAFLSVCEWVKVYYLWRPNLPDEGDNHLVELAMAGGADAIVTNNLRDVRRGEPSFPPPLSPPPREFLKPNPTLFPL